MNDQLIIELFIQRSEEAIKALAEKYGKLSVSISKNILSNNEDAEECVNDAYLAVWNNIPPENPNRLDAYLCKIVRNLSLKKYRYNTAECRNSRYDSDIDELAECIAGPDDPLKTMEHKALTESINLFLEKQKKIDRIIFIKKYWFFMDSAEIAKELGLSINYVNVHLHRTRDKLKKYMKENQ